MEPKDALARLLEGNERYLKDNLENPNRCVFRRQEIEVQQKPFAVIVGCSDSRVAPEILFDRGLGDLFTIRVAGNVIGPIERDSIDFAVRDLGSTLILVLGHESCGLVTAVMEDKTQDIEAIASLIQPSIQGAKTIQDAVVMNVHAMVNVLKGSPYLKNLVSLGKIDIVGACYHLGPGNVEILT